jgi:hypothetical protein
VLIISTVELNVKHVSKSIKLNYELNLSISIKFAMMIRLQSSYMSKDKSRMWG